MKKLLTLLPLVFILLSACQGPRIAFTQEFRKANRLTLEELKSLQFYISRDIVLRRGKREKNKQSSNGRLIINDKDVIEEIIIPAGTPCVVERVLGPDRLALRFGDRHDEFLVFGSLREDKGYYTLQALEWHKGRGKVAYGGKYYYAQRGSNQSILLVRARHVRTLVHRRRVVNGQILSGQK